jgi:hypothetical protein
MKKSLLWLTLLITPCIRAQVPCVPIDGENLWRLVASYYLCFSSLDADLQSISDEISSSSTDIINNVCSGIDVLLQSATDIIVTDVCSCIDAALLSATDTIIMATCSCVDRIDININVSGSIVEALCSCVEIIVNSATDVVTSELDVITSELESLSSCLVGTAITNAMIPFTISAPGLYYVCETINWAGIAPAITISGCFDVTLDLGGHALECVQSIGISIDTSISKAFDIVVKNGIIDAAGVEYEGGGGGVPALSVTGAEGVYISDIVVTYGSDVCFLISGSSEVTIDRCHFDNYAGFFTGLANPGSILINSDDAGFASDAILVRDCDVYNPSIAGFSVYIPIELIVNNKAEIRFERCYVRSDQGTTEEGTPILATPYGFYFAGQSGLIVVAKDCSASMVITGFYNTLTETVEDFPQDPLILDSCVAIQCNNGFVIDGGGTGGSPRDKMLLNCTASGCFVNGFSCSDVLNLLFRGCISQFNTADGFFIDATLTSKNILFEECIATGNDTNGFEITSGINTIANVGFKSCTAANNIGIGFVSSLYSVIIKDCLAMNNLQGINVASGSFILDTRSGAAGAVLNTNPDSTGGSTVVTY